MNVWAFLSVVAVLGFLLLCCVEITYTRKSPPKDDSQKSEQE